MFVLGTCKSRSLLGYREATDCLSMVKENISSAMVMESDADWDMRIHESMTGLAHGVRRLVDWPFNEEHNAEDYQVEPYGNSWDIIWTGHCGAHSYGNVRAYNWNDSAVPPDEDHEWKISNSLSKDQHPPGTRSVFQLQGAICSTGYAISLRGARKLTQYFKEGDSPIDIHLSDLCYDKPELTCLGVYPQIITNTKSMSNIDHPDVDDLESWHKQLEEGGKKHGEILGGAGIQYSARKNAPKVLANNAPEEEWIAEWDTEWKEVNGTRTTVKIDRSTRTAYTVTSTAPTTF